MTIMTTRSIEFFMMPQEFFDFVSVDLAPLDLELILAKGSGWNSTDQHPRRPHYLAPRGGNRPVTSRLEILHPAREGWVSVNPPPVIEGKTLYLAVIAVRSQWIDLETETSMTNPEVLRLFGQVARRLRKRLEFSVVGYSLSTYKSAVYKSIGHSEGARTWLKNAGEWRQQGVGNVGFGLP
ncbi:MAG: hypothetical protein ABI837_01220 [Acidobacteriota bacterium]